MCDLEFNFADTTGERSAHDEPVHTQVSRPRTAFADAWSHRSLIVDNWVPNQSSKGIQAMWSYEDDDPSSLKLYPRGGVAPLRHDVALHDYLRRRAEHSSTDRRFRVTAVAQVAKGIVRAVARHAHSTYAPGRRVRRLMAAAATLAAGYLLITHHADAKDMLTLNVIEHAGDEVITDLGAEGDSAGDLLTFNNEVYDEENAKRVGSIHGWCIRVVAGKSWECFWTLFHDDGQITVEGPFLDAGNFSLAITGGTGKYTGVRGDMLLHARSADGSAYDLKYNLMQ